MIVKDKDKILNLADGIAKKLIDISAEEGKQFDTEGDPADHIYLLFHTAGMYVARLAVALEGYGKMYGIEGLSTDFVCEIIDEIRNQLITLNKDNFKKTMQ